MEKSDFHTLLFLIEPGDTKEKQEHLLSLLQECEAAYEANTPMSVFAPHLTCRTGEGLKDFSLRYQDFLCREKAARLTQALFDEDHFPKAMLTGKKPIRPSSKEHASASHFRKPKGAYLWK